MKHSDLDCLITGLNYLATNGREAAQALQQYMKENSSEFDFDEIIGWLEDLNNGVDLD